MAADPWDQWLADLRAQDGIAAPPEAEVIGVQFGLLSAEEIAQLSAVEIKNPTTTKTGVVQRDGVTDSRLGTSQRSMLCGTCGCDHEQCAVGHSGHLVLAAPVPNAEFLATLHKILECVCIRCSRLRLPKDFPSYEEIIHITNDKERLKRLHDACYRRKICESWQQIKRRRKIHQREKRRGTTFLEEEQKLREEEGLDESGVEECEELTVEEILERGQGCGAVQPYWIREDGIILRPVFPLTEEDRGQPPPIFTPQDMFRMLQNITEADIKILGMHPQYARPSSLLWKNFYVPTVNIRPSKMGRSGNTRCPNEDDLTLRLKGIERANSALAARLKKETGSKINLAKYSYQNHEYNTVEDAWANPLLVEGVVVAAPPPKAPRKETTGGPVSLYILYDRLYRAISTYQNNKLTGKGVQPYGKQRKSIRCRFRGQKKNRVRGTVTGKRMNWVARAVITPNPTMHIHDVGVPKWVAMHLSYPARVNPYNVQHLTTLVRHGPHVYPGARYVHYEDGHMVDLDSDLRHTLELNTGMIVERHLLDGDDVIMNRQPTLHKHSMMAHRIKVIHASVNTFELHLAVTEAYNADFDGDEMNMLVLQSEESRAEAREIMSVDQCILKDDSPIVKFVQNPVTSSYILTDPRTRLREDHLFQMLSQHLQWTPDRLPDRSSIRPDADGHRYYTGHQVFSCILPRGLFVSKDGVVIYDGVMREGQWTKKSLNGHGGLIYTLVRDFGASFAADFITGTYNFLAWYETAIRGFTVALDDCYVPRSVLGTEELKKHTIRFFRQCEPSDLEARSLEAVRIERDLNEVTNRVKEIMGQRAVAYFKRLCDQDGHRNGLLDLVTSGAKGNPSNTVEIASCLGQNYNHRSKRYPRSTVHFNHPDADPTESHGMIYDSFMHGLNPIELFFHIASAHSGLVDTAVRTAFTGYMQRRIAKSLEDMVTDRQGRVINSLGDVLQVQYGGDGYLPRELERDKITLLQEGDNWRQRFTPEEVQRLEPLRREALDVLCRHRDREEFPVVCTPLHFTRAFQRLSASTPATPVSSRDQVYVWQHRIWTHVAPLHAKLRLYIYDHLGLAALLRWPATPLRLQRLEEWLVVALQRARIPEGELVGQEGAQSIGEPVTQMTLDSFHDTGALSTLTSGVPRVGEIINASAKQSTPSMHIYLRPDADGVYPTEAQVEAKGCLLIQRYASEFIVKGQMNPERSEALQARLNLFADQVLEVTATDLDDEEDEPAKEGAEEVVVPEEEEEDDGAEEEEEEEVPEDEEDDEEEEYLATEDADDNDVEDPGTAEADEDILDEEEDTEDVTEPSPEAPILFHPHPRHFLLQIFLKDLIPVRLEELAGRCRVYLGLESLGWAYGYQPSPWMAIAGRIDSPDLMDWLVSMKLPPAPDLDLIEGLLLEHVGNTTITGIRNLTDFCVTSCPFPSILPDGRVHWEDRHYLVTRGSNLKQVLQLPWVDSRLTYCNDILETERLLGVDAARHLIQKELLDVMSACGASVSSRHLGLLADRMTLVGHVVPTTYTGICLPGTSVIRNASFESAIETFLNGAQKGELDPCRGMTECVVVNRDLQGGTGLVRVVSKAPVAPAPKVVRRNQLRSACQVAGLEIPSDAWIRKIRQKATRPALPPPAIVPAAAPVAAAPGMTSASRRRKRAMRSQEPTPAPVTVKRIRNTVTAAAPLPVPQAAPVRSHPLPLPLPTLLLPRFKPQGIRVPFVPFDPRTLRPPSLPLFKVPGQAFRVFQSS